MTWAAGLTAGLMTGVAAQAAVPRLVLAEPDHVEMTGVCGGVYSRGLDRLARDPFTTPLVLADVNFGMNRWFTNYSGDISGRFIEVSSMTSTRENPKPAILREVLDKITTYQKADGHFGAEVDWNKTIDFDKKDTDATMMPILWGNGRLLLGLISAYERFGDKRLLESAIKLGDFYEKIVEPRFCDPKRVNEYHKPAAYAGAYVTCVYQGLEGLVRLYRTTHDARFLKLAERMADFHEAFDTLPVDHSHGSISVHGALLMLYEETGNTRYLRRVTERWDKAVQGGFVNPAGGVLEKYWVTGYDRDEGCSEADWLRLNLMLWKNTGETRYLDMAERLLWSAFMSNQWPSGGFGHRHIGCDAQGAFAFLKPSQESLWCCSFHAPLSLYELKRYLVAAEDKQSIDYNFPLEFKAAVKSGRNEWTVSSEALPIEVGIPVRCQVSLSGKKDSKTFLRVRVPSWAERVVIKSNGKELATTKETGYVKTASLNAGAVVEIAYQAHPYLENRRFERVALPAQLPAALDQVVLRNGPFVMMNLNSGDIQTLPLEVSADGHLQMPKEHLRMNLAPWFEIKNPSEPHAFVFNARLEKSTSP